jgi:hypothetical protein
MRRTSASLRWWRSSVEMTGGARTGEVIWSRAESFVDETGEAAEFIVVDDEPEPGQSNRTGRIGHINDVTGRGEKAPTTKAGAPATTPLRKAR